MHLELPGPHGLTFNSILMRLKVSTLLVLAVVFLLNYEPFNAKTLKKPTWVFAFLCSVILVAVNIGEIIAIIIPVLNRNAGPRKFVKLIISKLVLVQKNHNDLLRELLGF